jgi:hypothetical protein
MIVSASQRLDGERWVVDNHSSTKAERTKDVATKPSDAGSDARFLSGAAIGFFGGAILGAVMTLAAMISAVNP